MQSARFSCSDPTYNVRNYMFMTDSIARVYITSRNSVSIVLSRRTTFICLQIAIKSTL